MLLSAILVMGALINMPQLCQYVNISLSHISSHVIRSDMQMLDCVGGVIFKISVI